MSCVTWKGRLLHCSIPQYGIFVVVSKSRSKSKKTLSNVGECQQYSITKWVFSNQSSTDRNREFHNTNTHVIGTFNS